jgi:septal ring factor EnvC (AmiA/AmiB activator)
MTYYPDAPKSPVSASELIRQQQDILARNGENERKRQNLAYLEGQAADIQRRIDELIEKQKGILADLEIARKSALDLHDENTEELERNIADIEAVNIKVRANLDREKAEIDALDYASQYNEMTDQINEIRRKKLNLLNGAHLPLPGLSVEDGELTYNGYKWDGMSGSDQLKTATAIVRAINPKCGFVLIDKLEQMDVNTLREFGGWLESEGLQAIATRISTGDECAIVISDGYAVPTTSKNEPSWKAGEF